MRRRDVDDMMAAGQDMRDVVYLRAERPALLAEAVTWRRRQQRYARFALDQGVDVGLHMGNELTALIEACLDRDPKRAESARRHIESGILETLNTCLDPA